MALAHAKLRLILPYPALLRKLHPCLSVHASANVDDVHPLSATHNLGVRGDWAVVDLNRIWLRHSSGLCYLYYPCPAPMAYFEIGRAFH